MTQQPMTDFFRKTKLNHLKGDPFDWQGKRQRTSNETLQHMSITTPFNCVSIIAKSNDNDQSQNIIKKEETSVAPEGFINLMDLKRNASIFMQHGNIMITTKQHKTGVNFVIKPLPKPFPFSLAPFEEDPFFNPIPEPRCFLESPRKEDIPDWMSDFPDCPDVF
jgi:hypothetical protein